MIHNEESPEILKGKVKLINHVHISEPRLKPIETRKLHQNVKDILLNEGYQRFVSIEMAKVADIVVLKNAMAYVKGVFN